MEQTEHPIGIIGAMQIEVQHLQSQLTECRESTTCGLHFYQGKLHGKNTVVVQSGIGKVHAARCAQALIDLFAPRALLNTGIAGGIGSGLHVGDVVVASELAQHDFDLSPLGFVPGCLAGMGYQDHPTFFKTDAALSKILTDAAQTIAPDRGIHNGCVVSGDVFVASPDTKKELSSRYHALAAEMEGGAIAHVAYFAGVPFSVLRVLSDLADGSAPANYAEFEKESAGVSARIVQEAITKM